MGFDHPGIMGDHTLDGFVSTEFYLNWSLTLKIKSCLNAFFTGCDSLTVCIFLFLFNLSVLSVCVRACGCVCVCVCVCIR